MTLTLTSIYWDSGTALDYHNVEQINGTRKESINLNAYITLTNIGGLVRKAKYECDLIARDKLSRQLCALASDIPSSLVLYIPSRDSGSTLTSYLANEIAVQNSALEVLPSFSWSEFPLFSKGEFNYFTTAKQQGVSQTDAVTIVDDSLWSGSTALLALLSTKARFAPKTIYFLCLTVVRSSITTYYEARKC